MRISDWSSDVCSSDLFVKRFCSTVFREVSFDGGTNIIGLHCGSVANNRIAVAIHQKFGEVPFDGPAAQYAGRLLHTPLIERVREWTVHVDLLEHRDGHSIVLMTEGVDLIRSSRLLMKELIAGKAQHRAPAGRKVDRKSGGER